MATVKKTTKITKSVSAKDESRPGRAVKKTTTKKPDSGYFAVIQTGGKQYLVKEGETLKIEKLVVENDDKIVFDEILLVSDGKETKIGTPYVSGAKVTAKIEGDVRAKKITVIRYKSKTRQFKKKGHRQTHTKITITDIK